MSASPLALVEPVPAEKAVVKSARDPGWGAISRGHRRAEVVAALAVGDLSHKEIGDRFGVCRQAVDRFARKFDVDVRAARERLADEYGHLWAASKVARIAEYQQQVEDIADMLGDPEKAARAGVGYAEMARAAQSALRAIAEELGQLPARTLRHEGGVSVRYEVVGVAMDALA